MLDPLNEKRDTPRKMSAEEKYKIILTPCKVTGHSFGKFLKQPRFGHWKL